MVELTVNELPVLLPENTSIKYTRQISDIFDIAQVSCSYTNSFSFEKTIQNTQAMSFLGIPGDNSSIPYIKNTASLKSNGISLITKGWFNVTETNDKYNGNIVDGMIDFFKAIENKTLGNDLNLSNFEHQKTIANVVNSYSNPYYRYIIADYGGKIFFDGGINIDYLTPSFSVRKLWELIFSTFGFQCDYTYLSSYIDSLFITYPKEVSSDITLSLIATLQKGYFNTIYSDIAPGGFLQPGLNTGFYLWDSNTITDGYLVDGGKYVIPETNSYRFEFEGAMYATYKSSNTYDIYIDVSITILKNGLATGAYLSSTYNQGDFVGNTRTTNINITCNKGDVIEILAYVPRVKRQSAGAALYNLYSFTLDHLLFKIYRTDLGTTSLSNELKEFQIKDFIKEIIWRAGLLPIYSQFSNIVSFIPISSRLDFLQAQDMSRFYKERVSETYQNDYAQKNALKLKTDNVEDTTGDGYLYVNNKNIADQKTIVQSKIYAPDKGISTGFTGFSTNQYRIWATETKLKEDNSVEVNYKGLSGRFYFLRFANMSGTYKFTSERLTGSTTISNVSYAINTNTLFEEAIYNNYSGYQKIFNNFRVHTISMTLNIVEFMKFDFLKPVFFEQENAYYICNSLTYEEGKLSTGEFIKINNI